MNFFETKLPGVIKIEPEVHKDARGFFLESFHFDRYRKAGIDVSFVQDNHSKSEKGVLRGLHLQVNKPQGKLIRAVEGDIFDVAVDIRLGSPTYKQWVGEILSAEKFNQLYLPPGFAHGFYVLSKVAQVEYKCTEFYDPQDELSLRWDDPAIGIQWPAGEKILSKRDQNALTLDQAKNKLPSIEAIKK